MWLQPIDKFYTFAVVAKTKNNASFTATPT